MRTGSRIVKVIATALIVVLVSGLRTPALAAGQGPSSAELEAFRARLAQWMQDMATDQASGTEAVGKVLTLPVADLTVLYKAYPKDGPFWEAPRKTKAFLNSDAAKAAIAASVRAKQQTAAAPNGAAGLRVAEGALALDTDAPCPAGFNYEALWVARDAEMVADIAMEVIPEDFTTSPFYIVAATAWSFLKATLFIVDQVYERWDDCETSKVFEKMDAPISSRASQASVDGLSSQIGDLQTKLGALGPVELAANVIDLKDALKAATPQVSRPSGAVRIFNTTGQLYVDFPADDRELGRSYFMTPTGGLSVQAASIHVPQGTIAKLYGNTDFDFHEMIIDGTASGTPATGIDRSDLFALFPPAGPRSMRVTQTTITNPDLIASQKSIDTLSAKVDALSLGGSASGASTLQTTLNSIQASVTNLPRLDTPVSSRASQSSVNQLQTGVTSVQTTVGSIQATSSAVQANVATLQAAVGTLQGVVDQLKTDVGVVKTGIAAVDLSKLDAPVTTRASQAGLDAVGASVQTRAQEATLKARADAIDVSIGAVQQKVNGLDTARLDAPVSSRAQESTLKSRADAIDGALTALQQKANALDTTRLDANISSRAQESTLVGLGTTTAAGLQAIQAKVNALDTGKLDAAMSSRASQSSLDAGLASLLVALKGQASLSVQVVEIQKRKRYLVYVTLAGAPISGAALSRFQTLELTDNKPAIATDGTAGAAVVEVAPGILDVTLNLPGGKTDAVAVTVTHGSGAAAMTGSTILQTK